MTTCLGSISRRVPSLPSRASTLTASVPAGVLSAVATTGLSAPRPDRAAPRQKTVKFQLSPLAEPCYTNYHELHTLFVAPARSQLPRTGPTRPSPAGEPTGGGQIPGERT